MNFRKPLAALALAGALAVGYAGVAGAQTPAPAAPSTPTTQSQHHFTCEGAKDRLAKLQKRDDEIKAHIAKAEARRDQLVAEGKTDQAAALTKRIDAAKDRLGKVEARVEKVKDAVAKRCDNHANPGTAATPAT